MLVYEGIAGKTPQEFNGRIQPFSALQAMAFFGKVLMLTDGLGL